MNKIEIEKNKKELEFEHALALRNFEITLFWQRAWFFGVLLGGITGAYYELYKDHIEFCIYFSFLALLVSVAQCLMNRGSKYWQERWEYHTKHKESLLEIDVTKTEQEFTDAKGEKYHEKDLIEAYILAKGEKSFLRGARFSVSKLAMMVWDIIAFLLFLLWMHDVIYYINRCKFIWIVSCRNYYHSNKILCDTTIVSLIHIIVIAYILYFFLKKGQIYEPLGENLKPEPKPKKNEKFISRKILNTIYPAGKFVDL